MKIIKKVWGFTRLVLVILAILSFLVIGLIVLALFRNGVKRRKFLTHMVSFYARLATFLLHIRPIYITNGFDPKGLQHYLVVSNHLTYLDVVVMAAYFPSVFITSREIQKTPVLGWITDLGGCAYVDRKNKSRLPEEIAEIADIIKTGLNVVIFPEATSTNGEQILLFRRPLYNCAIEAGVPVLPLAIKYLTLDGEEITSKTRDAVCWYGDMTFFPHLVGLTKFNEITVQLEFLTPIQTKKDSDITDLAERSRAAIVEKFVPYK
jgi:1-acyl-sn-glycerol-3-phosphate acyltransferase